MHTRHFSLVLYQYLYTHQHTPLLFHFSHFLTSLFLRHLHTHTSRPFSQHTRLYFTCFCHLHTPLLTPHTPHNTHIYRQMFGRLTQSYRLQAFNALQKSPYHLCFICHVYWLTCLPASLEIFRYFYTLLLDLYRGKVGDFSILPLNDFLL